MIDKPEEEKKEGEEDKEEEEDNIAPEVKKYIERLTKERTKKYYEFKWIMIHGSYPLSLLFVDSIHTPRHVRWTLLMGTICLLWFWCAVIFNNTKNPLDIPDTVSKYIVKIERKKKQGLWHLTKSGCL